MAENLFLRKQLALFREREAKPRGITRFTRIWMVALGRLFDWRETLVVVKPETFVKWHRTSFRMFWRWKSRCLGRPKLPGNLRDLIRQMARENATWGEERIAKEIGSRRILHCNVTEHPTADWTTQQFRETLDEPHPFRFLIHDRDAIFSPAVDITLKDFGICVRKTPKRAPKANAYCEPLVGTIRRECLDYLIPLNERHLRLILKEFVAYYNRGRPHAALGPGVPEPIQGRVPASGHRHRLPVGYHVGSTGVLGGLHHVYRLEKEAA